MKSPAAPHAARGDHAVPERVVLWAARAAWLVLPLTAGSAVEAAIAGHSPDVRLALGALAWAGWGAGVLAALVLHPVALTAARILGPLATIGVVAAIPGRPAPTAVAAMVSGLLATATVFSPVVGRCHVNGAAYPNERRFPLRIPGPLLLGAVQLAWLATVAVPIGTVLLAASHRVVAAAVTAVVGGPVAVVAARALHKLARRWIVFVPAGVVLHDRSALRDPVLFMKANAAGLTLAPAATSALDLTLGAFGPALELRLRERTELGRRIVGRRAGDDDVAADALLFAPTRPGAVLAEAATRRVAIG